MIKQSSLFSLLLLLTIILAHHGKTLRLAEAGKRRIHITDELDDVVDDEEDEAWKEWGKKSTPSDTKFDPPPTDFSKMDTKEIQAEMMKRQFGPVFGFAKLRLGVRRTPDMVSEIAKKWTKLSKTGGIEVKFMRVDLSTIMFTMEKGQDSSELKDFILNQPEAYEIKIGDQAFRRPGDPPLDEILEKLYRDKNEADNASPEENGRHQKDEL
ncbi:uncharacterized protein LOC132298988 [Cornus florida]|uniref:uncharacterized protein LOC132298988 n=1 Tax=Cornus florida TaxID=4283 RepID=UPI00289E3B7B|nr:uncharacterized protein LOC132298988 [Cornus florida]